MHMKRVFTTMVLAASTLALVGCADGYRKDVGGLLGAVAGGFLGAEIGSGSGRLVATGAGAVLGGLIGADIGDGLDKAQVATRPAPNYVPSSNHPAPPPTGQSGYFGSTNSGYARHAPAYNHSAQNVSQTSAGYNVSGCNQLAGSFRTAFACQDSLGRWFVVQ